MKSLLKIFKKEEIKSSLKHVIHRFPLALLLSGIITLLFFFLIAGGLDDRSIQIIITYILTLTVTFFLSVAISLLSESLNLGVGKGYISQIGAVIFGILFYYFFPESFDNFHAIVFFLLTLSGIIASIFIAPYLKFLNTGSYNEQGYYVYFYRISVVFFLSFIIGGVLTALGNIAILTVTTLFDIGYAVGGDIHLYWTAFALSFLTPLFALTQLPRKGSFQEQYFNENAFFHFMIRYIALPFIFIYFVILYAYTIKVLFNFGDWPKGEVSWMVIGFSIFGYIIYIFSYIFEQGKRLEAHKFVHIFRKYFPIIIIPQLGMLFYAIALRIGQYDFTINRYFVVVFGVWLLICSMYLIISKKKSLLFIPTLLTIFTLIISVGPWSVYNFPLERQKTRLIENLIEANILQNSEIIPLDNYNDISPELSNNIYSGIGYLCDFNNCKDIKEIFPKIYDKLLETNKDGLYDVMLSEEFNVENRPPNKWRIQQYISETIKVQSSYSMNDDSNIYRMYSENGFFPLEVTGYEFVLQANSYDFTQKEFKANIDNKKQILTITNGEKVDSISLQAIIELLRQDYKKNNNFQLDDLSNRFTFESESYEGIFIVESANIFADPDYEPINDYDEEYVSGIILLRDK